ncbi:MAG: elongation factor G [Candidatus Latescibacteria bacterium]|nr:elongation factor G [Candidatus Latescibacterota bacterium]NIM66512.1 elongation factor G [Candidatus Latescibacterota bacterium]NIO02992.1 elongation factor G [Candidatus Latescibacterota bacterium]NIO30127.1 elongation factor G [Candidatus Latescibacterota bacterium]NIO57746.1 elongation factor G [Candidatus Latescibacterota bacterium]
MKEYSPDKIRNIALAAHQDTGKTALSEAILYTTGVINRIGRVEDGNTVMDANPDEVERQISIQTGLAFGEFQGNKINILDTPGYEDFVGEVLCALDVVEGCLIPIRADGGVEVGTEKIWTYVRDRNLPTLFCINKMDKEHADFNNCIAQLREHFGNKVLPVQLPIGEGESFKGVVDLLQGKGFEYSTDGRGTSNEVDIPDDVKDKASEWRHELLETAAETSEELMEKYLESESLTKEELVQGLSAEVSNGEMYPVFCVSAVKNIGIPQLLQGIIDLVPPPDKRPRKAVDGEMEIKGESDGPAAVSVFKNVSESHVGDMLYIRMYRGSVDSGKDIYNPNRETTERLGQLFLIQGKNRTEVNHLAAGDMGAVVKLKNTKVGDTLCAKNAPVRFAPTVLPRPSIFTAISGLAKGDEEKISMGLSRLKEEDPTFEVKVDNEVRQTLISGQGELHLEVIIGRLKKRFGVEVQLKRPKVPYKETITAVAEAQGKYKKQTGGRGQYGDVWLKLEPLPRGSDFEFVNAIVGGVVPGKFIPAVEKGIVAAMSEGVIAKFPVVDLKATLYDGSYHSVDSSEQAFKTAGSMAFKKATQQAKPVLLEPIMNVEVKVPEDFMGDVMGDLSGRRGKIQGMDPEGRFNVVKAQVPLSELYRYSTHLRSLTQGRGTHKREFSHYEEVPHDIAQKIIEEVKKEKEEKQ